MSKETGCAGRGTDIARFARRGVKVISLPGSRTQYSQVLATTFDELREYMQTHLIAASHVTEEEPLTEFALPQEAVTRLCFFAVPLALQPQYRDQVFPLAERAGLVPVTAADVIAPGENYSAKIDAIMRRSIAAVVDGSTQNTLLELGMLMGMGKHLRLLVVAEEDAVLPKDIAGQHLIRRVKRPIADQPELLRSLEVWFRSVARDIQPRLAEEPRRLLASREYRAAVIAAMTHLEARLRAALEKDERLPGRAYSIGPLADLAVKRELLSRAEHERLRDWMRVRNMVVHSQDTITKARATEIVNGAMEIGQRLTVHG